MKIIQSNLQLKDSATNVFLGHDVSDKQPFKIQLELNEGTLKFDLKGSVERNILLDLFLRLKDLSTLAKAFEVKISIYPSGILVPKKYREHTLKVMKFTLDCQKLDLTHT